jgi:hypothetical protein
VPVGSAAADVAISDVVHVQFPVQLDGQWRVGRAALGGYVSWALARPGGCPGGTSCDASIRRFGAQATFTFVPPGRMAAGEARRSPPAPEPWAGISAGWEQVKDRRSRAGNEISTRWHGFELVAVQAGLDWPIGAGFAVGPALLVGLGRYTDIHVDTGYDSDVAQLSRTTLHAWFHLGVRVRVRLEPEAR